MVAVKFTLFAIDAILGLVGACFIAHLILCIVGGGGMIMLSDRELMDAAKAAAYSHDNVGYRLVISR